MLLIEMDAPKHHLNKAEVCGGRVVMATARKAPAKGIFKLGSLPRFLLVALSAQILSNHQQSLPGRLASSRCQNVALAAGGNILQQIVSIVSTGLGGKVLIHAIK